MKDPSSVGGGDRLRLFCALRLPDDAIERIVWWQHEELRGRIVPPHNLHVTIAFLGSRPSEELAAIAEVLRESSVRAERPVLRARRYRETRSVGMLVLDDEGARATRFAERVQKRLERLGVYRRERRPWLPHVTVVRFREQPRLRPVVPDLGEVSPSEAAVYHSVLRPGGAQYEVLESVPLGG